MLALTLLTLFVASASADFNQVIVGGATDEFYPLFSAEILEQGASCAIRDYPVTVYGQAGALLNQYHVVVCGGYSETTGQTGDCYDYSFPEDKWFPMASLNSPRSFHASAKVGDRIYMIGGELGVNLVTSVESLNPETELWEPETGLPNGVKLACAVGLEDDNSIFVTGGTGDGGAAAVLRYDIATKVWQEMPKMTFGHSDQGCMAYNYQGRDGVIVSGGQSTPLQTKFVEFFDIAAQTWETIAPLPTPRFGHEMGNLGAGTPTAVGGFFGAPVAQLSEDDAEWAYVDGTGLMTPRSWFAMIEVPAETINCETLRRRGRD